VCLFACVCLRYSWCFQLGLARSQISHNGTERLISSRCPACISMSSTDSWQRRSCRTKNLCTAINTVECKREKARVRKRECEREGGKERIDCGWEARERHPAAPMLPLALLITSRQCHVFSSPWLQVNNSSLRGWPHCPLGTHLVGMHMCRELKWGNPSEDLAYPPCMGSHYHPCVCVTGVEYWYLNWC